MLLKWVNEYWLLYVMAGIAVLGVGSRLYLNGIYRGLLRDLNRNGAPKRRLVQQMKKNYESCCQRKEGVKDMDSFISASLYTHRFCGMTVDGLKRISGHALFLCAIAMAAVAAAGWFQMVDVLTVETYAVADLIFLVLIMDVVWITDAGRKQELLEINMLNYLNNRLPAEAWEPTKQEEKLALMNELRERKEEKKLAKDTENDILYLKKSLQQIAAEREKGQADGSYTLTPEEGQLVEEILEGFLG